MIMSRYWVEWGDGTHTGWIGPYPSGAHVATNHTWMERGSYAITAKAKDIYEAESNFSAPLIMNVTGPQINVVIRPRGIGAAATILNCGEETARNVSWTITLNGGIIIFGGSNGDTIDTVLPGESIRVTSFFFGLFRSTITATADNDSDALGGLLIGPYLFSVTKNKTFNGTVKKIKGEKIQVVNVSTSLEEFRIGDGCKFKAKNGTAIDRDKIKVGAKVKVTWVRSQGTAGNTERVAIEIQLME